MDNIYIKKDDLNYWIAKYFKQDLISIDDLIECIEDLGSELDSIKEELDDLKEDIQENYKPISKSEQYDIRDCEFI